MREGVIELWWVPRGCVSLFAVAILTTVTVLSNNIWESYLFPSAEHKAISYNFPKSFAVITHRHIYNYHYHDKPDGFIT